MMDQNKLVKTKHKVFFVVSVDTEEEWDWNGSFPEKNFSVKNTRYIGRFQSFCNQLGVKPTYFVDYAIVDNPESAEPFKAHLAADQCEIGAHLHPWCNPPVEEQVNHQNSYIVNLAPDLVEKKILQLKNKLHDVYAIKPTSFRSGRWGINGRILSLLSQYGFEVDSSIFPFYADSCFDYNNSPETPFWPGFSDASQPGEQKQILEIPVTSGFNNPYFKRSNAVFNTLAAKPFSYFKPIGILWKLHLLRKIALSPELAATEDMISCIQSALKRGHRVIHMFFHSSSLLRGGSPYVRTKADEVLFYNKMKDVFTFMQTNTDAVFCTITEAKQKLLEEID